MTKLQRKLTSLQDLEIQVATPTVADAAAASIVAGPVGLLHSAGGTAFELFQKTVYLIFDAGRRAGHLFARHSSANVNVQEMEARVDLIRGECWWPPRLTPAKWLATFYGVERATPKSGGL